jgi:Ras-related protein Rab-1A
LLSHFRRKTFLILPLVSLLFLDPTMEQAERIQKLQKTLEDLRKTYNHVKGELTALERRRKKMRRKDKDRTQKNQAELVHNS